jgi:hypothetical protein
MLTERNLTSCQWAQLALTNWLTALDTIPGTAPLAGLKLRLWQNNFVPTQLSEVADFTETDFSGYAAQAVTAGATIEPNSNQLGRKTFGNWTATNVDPFVPNTVYGMYATNAAGTEWYCAWRFPVAVPIASRYDSLVAFATFSHPYSLETAFG